MSTTKKLIFISCACALILSACMASPYNSRIKLEYHFKEIDYHAQEICVKSNVPISYPAFDWAESDSDKGKDHYEDNKMIRIGDWFKIIMDKSDRKHLILSVDENDTGKDRVVVVRAICYAESDTVRVVQKAKPF